MILKGRGVGGSMEGSDHVLKYLHNWVGVFTFIENLRILW